MIARTSWGRGLRRSCDRSHAIPNVNLWVGISLLATSAFFITWAMLRPPGRELQEDKPAREDDDYERQRFTREPAASPAGRSASRQA